MKLFLILIIIGVCFIFLGYANQLKQYSKKINTINTTTIKYIPRDVYDDMALSNLI